MVNNETQNPVTMIIKLGLSKIRYVSRKLLFYE